MSGFDLAALTAAVARHGRVARVVVAQVRGSAPREPGAAMLVWDDGFAGTIGGGALEWEALAEARRRLRGEAGPGDGRSTAAGDGLRAIPLGPGLGQCCGGAVSLAFELFDRARAAAIDPDARLFARPLGGPSGAAPAPIQAAARADPPPPIAVAPAADGRAAWIAEPLRPARQALFLYGAGHVGRAIVRVAEGLPFALTWVDDAPARFPDPLPAHVDALPAANPADATALAPDDAVHLVMTYSHALDLEICHRVLGRGAFARLGVIGSATKAVRFRSRLRDLGHADAAVGRMACPIGMPGLGGKAPAEIAVAVAAELLAHAAAQPVRRRA